MNKILNFCNFTLTLNERINESKRLLNKYPHKIPVIFYTNDNNISIKKNKYLAYKTFTFDKLILLVRKEITLINKDGLFFMVNNKIMMMNDTIETIYNKEKNIDGFLYICVCKEETFG